MGILNPAVSRARQWRAVRAVAVCAVVAFGVTACGDDGDADGQAAAERPGDEVVAVDVGSAEIRTDGPLKRVAVFVAGSAASYTWSAAMEAGAKEAAKEHGLDLRILEANFDPAAQFNQIQNALTSGQYQGLVIQPASPQACNLVKTQAVARKVLVAVVGASLCGQDDKDGEELWTEGTVTFVGGQYGLPGFVAYANNIAEAHPERTKVIEVIGPKEFGTTKAWDRATTAVYGDNPQLDVVARVYTDYSTPDAFRKTQDALQANRDADVVISQYIDMTKGIVRAADALGRKDLLVYDFGGSKESVGFVESGAVTATFPTYPRSVGAAGVDALARAAAGEKVPRFIGGDGNPDAVTTVLGGEQLGGFEPQF